VGKRRALVIAGFKIRSGKKNWGKFFFMVFNVKAWETRTGWGVKKYETLQRKNTIVQIREVD
jgi:hypothetical protein